MLPRATRGGRGRAAFNVAIPLQHELQYVLQEQNYYIVIVVQFLSGFNRVVFLNHELQSHWKRQEKQIKRYYIYYIKTYMFNNLIKYRNIYKYLETCLTFLVVYFLTSSHLDKFRLFILFICYIVMLQYKSKIIQL